MRVLYGLETVRLRPEMYAGSLDRPDLANQLLVDVLCEAADLHDLRAAFRVTGTLGADAHACIEDDGPGWSVAPTFEGPAVAEMMMTNLFGWKRGGESRPSYDLSIMGLPVLNALSAWAELTIWRDGHTHHQRSECGIPTQRLGKIGPADRTGTKLEFQLDASIVADVTFSAPWIRAWCADHVPTLPISVQVA